MSRAYIWPIFGRKLPKEPIMILYFDIWGQESIYDLSTGHITVTPGLQLSPFHPPPKKIRFRGTGRLPGDIPNFGHFWGVADHAGWITENDFFLLLLRYLSRSKMKVKSSAKLVLSPSAPFPYLSIGSMEVQSRKHHFTFIPNTTCHPIKSSTALRWS